MRHSGSRFNHVAPIHLLPRPQRNRAENRTLLSRRGPGFHRLTPTMQRSRTAAPTRISTTDFAGFRTGKTRHSGPSGHPVCCHAVWLEKQQKRISSQECCGAERAEQREMLATSNRAPTGQWLCIMSDGGPRPRLGPVASAYASNPRPRTEGRQARRSVRKR